MAGFRQRGRVLSSVSDHAWARLHASQALHDQDGCCAYCREPLLRSKATADHVRPKSAGGTTSRKNIKAACLACNQAKGSMSAREFKAAIRAPKPPRSMPILRAWIRLRIWNRTHQACALIERVCR